MRTVDQSQMHKDHLNWNSEVGMWEQDIRMWYQELESLGNALESIQAACEEHEKGLDAHLRAIREHSSSFQLDESYLAMIEPNTYPDNEVTAIHNEKSKHHQIHKDAHLRLKQYHHLVMVLTKQMKKVLEGPI